MWDEKVSPSSTANLPIALPQQPSCHPVGKDLRGGGGEKLKKKKHMSGLRQRQTYGQRRRR